MTLNGYFTSPIRLLSLHWISPSINNHFWIFSRIHRGAPGAFWGPIYPKKAYFCDDMQPWMSAKVLLSWFDSSSNLICHNIMNHLSVYQTVYWGHAWGLRRPNLPKICNISQNMLLEWSWMGVLVLFELGQFIWPLSTSIIILQFSTQSNRGTLEHLEV